MKRNPPGRETHIYATITGYLIRPQTGPQSQGTGRTLYPGYSTPARTSETVVLYGVGFGLPSTPLVNGSSTQSGTLSPQPVCTIAGIQAPVAFAGLVAPGLYQFNLTVPAGASTAAVVCTYNGNATAAGPLLAVQP